MARWNWKLIGLAGLASVVAIATAGVVVSRRSRRSWDDVDADELRRRLHDRLAAAERRTATTA